MASSNKLILEQPKKNPGQVAISVQNLIEEIDKTEHLVGKLEELLQLILSATPMDPEEAVAEKNESVDLARGINLLQNKQHMINRKLTNILERVEL